MFALFSAAALLLLFGVGYWFYAAMQVDPVTVEPNASEDQRIAAVDHWLNSLFESQQFNGGVLVVRNGEVLLSKTCGFTDETSKQRLNEHSAFRLASVSKQFTAAGVLRLAHMGLIDLEDPVAQHLSGSISDKVTIRHLLNQTSGIPDDYLSLADEHRDVLGDVLTISDVVELVTKHSKLERAPGTEEEYSNTNYVLLAGIVEAVSGKSFERFMQDELFEPLEMNDSRVWNLVSKDRSPNQADDFSQADGTPVQPTWLDGVAGDGAVFCSLHDFVIWDRFWDGSPLVSEDLIDKAFRRPKLNDGVRSDYGFGWVIERNRHWHDGAWLGANTYIVRYPESKCCLVVLDNSSNDRVDSIASRIEAALKPVFSEETFSEK